MELTERTRLIAEGILTNLKVAVPRIQPEARLRTDLGLDSLDMMEMGCKLEDVLLVPISDEDVGKMRTVRDLTEFIESKLGKKILQNGSPQI